MEITEAVVVPVAIAITSILKDLGVPSKFGAITSVVVSVAITLTFGGLTLESALKGLIFGLSASGLYSGTKAIVQG